MVQRQPLAWAAPAIQSVTPTPVEEEESVEETTEAEATEAETATTEPTLQELAERVDALQAQVDELEAHPMATGANNGLANEVATAVYLLNTIGLHELDVRLNEEKDLQAGDAGTVTRIAGLLSSVAWPAELATDAANLIDVLNQLGTALSNDDLATAGPLANQAHETQHDFSHAAEHWLGDVTVTSGSHDAGQPFRVTSAVYLLDTVGLHDLDVRLNEEQDLQAGDAGMVSGVVRLLSSVDWPDPLATDAMTLTTVLNDLATALTDDDLEAAAPLATQAHELQHDFSHAAEHWLADVMGAYDEGSVDSHSEEDHDHAADESEEQPADSHSDDDATHTENSGG